MCRNVQRARVLYNPSLRDIALSLHSLYVFVYIQRREQVHDVKNWVKRVVNY